MITLAMDELARVVGGEATTTTTSLPGVTQTTSRSDYATCVNTVVDQTAAAYPDTRPSVLGLPLPFTTDDNARARADATVSNILATCGQPR